MSTDLDALSRDVVYLLQQGWEDATWNPQRMAQLAKRVQSARDELLHLREQRDTLQKRGTELVKENQARHVAVVALEEMKHEYGNAAERAAMAERVIHKMMQASGTSTLTRAENIYVALLVERREQRADIVIPDHNHTQLIEGE